jgi:GDP-D-mannose dehydratase
MLLNKAREITATATGTVRLLEAVRETDLRRRFYQAPSSEMFGRVREISYQSCGQCRQWP